VDSVVIDDFYSLDPVWGPAEAYAPLVVNSNGMLTGSIAFERFEAVARRHPEVVELLGQIELDQFASSRRLNGGGKNGRAFIMENRLSGTAGEGFDHSFTVTHGVSNVKRN
jgi:hypothetical protein